MRQWHFGCNLHSRSDLLSTMRHLAVGAFVAIICLWALFALSARATAHARAGAAVEVASPSGSSAVSVPDIDRRQNEDDSAIDLSGNDVTEAVARYRLDATGSLYEVHSPQTEIPRLGSPKS